MDDQKRGRGRLPLRLKRESLRVLGWDELGQVIGGVHDAQLRQCGRGNSRYCPTTDY
jgi:hypothetical protein